MRYIAQRRADKKLWVIISDSLIPIPATNCVSYKQSLCLSVYIGRPCTKSLAMSGKNWVLQSESIHELDICIIVEKSTMLHLQQTTLKEHCQTHNFLTKVTMLTLKWSVLKFSSPTKTWLGKKLEIYL